MIDQGGTHPAPRMQGAAEGAALWLGHPLPGPLGAPGAVGRGAAAWWQGPAAFPPACKGAGGLAARGRAGRACLLQRPGLLQGCQFVHRGVPKARESAQVAEEGPAGGSANTRCGRPARRAAGRLHAGPCMQRAVIYDPAPRPLVLAGPGGPEGPRRSPAPTGFVACGAHRGDRCAQQGRDMTRKQMRTDRRCSAAAGGRGRAPASSLAHGAAAVSRQQHLGRPALLQSCCLGCTYSGSWRCA